MPACSRRTLHLQLLSPTPSPSPWASSPWTCCPRLQRTAREAAGEEGSKRCEQSSAWVERNCTTCVQQDVATLWRPSAVVEPGGADAPNARHCRRASITHMRRVVRRQHTTQNVDSPVPPLCTPSLCHTDLDYPRRPSVHIAYHTDDT